MKRWYISPLLIIGIMIFYASISYEKELPKIEKNTFTSAKVCGECHVEIYNMWKNSLHAMSLEDPIFQAANIIAFKNTNGETKVLCIRCHAPITYINKDYDLKQEITKEGVTCDFCHSVTVVDFKNRDNPYKLEPGLTKNGPLGGLTSPVHKTRRLKLFETSDLCGACHDFTDQNNVTILGTYSEWKAGPYAKEGIHCQDCHMPRKEGRIVAENIKKSDVKFINDHNIQGGHSIEQVKKAIKVEVKEVKRYPDKLKVFVDVSNVGSGHMVPTGTPSRKIVLDVTVKTTTGQLLKEQKVYKKTLVGAAGIEFAKDSDAMCNRSAISSDNRIKPKETRKEEFTFYIPQDVPVTVVAQAFYQYNPEIIQQIDINIEMGKDEKVSR
ncbi:MAG: hypothetical protein HZA05_06200 [Nitrospirae bacterium]|nr:hypothetical protein [Nitrospirota bacterium]